MDYTGLCTPQVEEKLVELALKPAQQKGLIYLMMNTSRAEPEKVLPLKLWAQICSSNTGVWKALSLMSDMSVIVDEKSIPLMHHVSYNAATKTLGMELGKDFMEYCTKLL